MEEHPVLIYSLTSENPSSWNGRLRAKLLVSSLLRNMPAAMIKFGRIGATDPLFKVLRRDFDELWIEAGRATKGETAPAIPREAPWVASEWIEGGKLEWVLFLGDGSLALRGVDHLLMEKADILWAPVPGKSLAASTAAGYLNASELEGTRVENPLSRPWREPASAAVWAVRGEHYAGVMAAWKTVAEGEPLRSDCDRLASAWNRVLIDSPLRVARFEKNEVQFPAAAGADYLQWKDAAIVNVADWPAEASGKFLQAWFYATYFGDSTGHFLDIVEP